MRVSTFCVGVKQSAQETTSFPDIIFPANKNVLLGRREHTDRIVNAFYLKSNQAHPSNKKCVGYQFIFILFNVNKKLMTESELEKFRQVCSQVIGCMPVSKGVRTNFIMTQSSILEEAKLEQGSDGSKKGELLKPLEAPSYLLTKSLELFNSFKDSKGRFNATDLRQRTKVWLNDHLKFHHENLSTFKPVELAVQTLKQMLKNFQDIINKRE